MPLIEIFQDDALISEHKLTEEIVSLGRHRENDIVLNEATISRFQARLENRQSCVALVNLANNKILKVNKELVEGEIVLSHNDTIEIANFKLHFKHPEGTETQISKNTTRVVNKRIVQSEMSVASSRAFDDFEQASTTVVLKSEPMLILLLNDEELSTTVVTNEIIVGRSKKAEICIALDGLSRQHARIFRKGEQTFIEDLGSQNGTWVNRIQVNGQQELKQGDLLNFYEYNILFLTSSFTNNANIPSDLVSEINNSPLNSSLFNEPAEVVSQTEVSYVKDLIKPHEEAFKEVKDISYSAIEKASEKSLSADDALFSLLRQQVEPTSAVLEIELDGVPYTQVTLSSQVTRIGSDARCEIALPQESGIMKWHLTLLKWSTGLTVMRALPSAKLKCNGELIESKVLEDGDRLTVGVIDLYIKIGV